MPAAPPQGAPLVTAEQLARLGVKAPGDWPLHITAACSAFQLTTRQRLATFLANVLHESGNLATFVENLNYKASALTAQWPNRFPPALAAAFGRNDATGQAANQPMIAEIAYGGRMGNRPMGWGDGWARRGRGAIQTTGEDNYRATGQALGVPLADLPAYLESPAGAVMSAAYFVAKPAIVAWADVGNIRNARSVLNVGRVVGPGEDASIIGLADVTARYRAALALL